VANPTELPASHFHTWTKLACHTSLLGENPLSTVGGLSPRAVYFSFKCFLLTSSAFVSANNSAPEGFVRILLVEDQSDAAEVLAKGLREQSYAVDIAADGEVALYQASINDYDLVVLDVMLPLRNGIEVCRSLRASGSAVPILMLTARDAVHDRVQGLDAGADDYLTKPFDLHELLARIRALLRRGPEVRPETVYVADLVIDTRSRRAWRSNRPIELTAKEYALLDYLARHVNRVVGRADIAEHVWDEAFDPFSNLIEVYIQRLRRKIDEGHSSRLLRTLRGEGYMLCSEEPHRDV
jgi:DNA-binding response OmpR family regulator